MPKENKTPSAAIAELIHGTRELISQRRTELAHCAQKPLSPRELRKMSTGAPVRGKAGLLPKGMLN